MSTSHKIRTNLYCDRGVLWLLRDQRSERAPYGGAVSPTAGGAISQRYATVAGTYMGHSTKMRNKIFFGKFQIELKLVLYMNVETFLHHMQKTVSKNIVPFMIYGICNMGYFLCNTVLKFRAFCT